MFEGFADRRVQVSGGVTLRVRATGTGPAVLLLHGYPQTHACWHRVAPSLVEAGFRVVASDLRGYGDSSKPPSDDSHAAYSKRAMARDQVEMMRSLGHERFAVAGHDRGGRVAHRMARDFPDRVRALAVLDIVPTEHMYAEAEREFATRYYHWFFLIQPAPLPETLIGADPEFYLKRKIGAWSSGDDRTFSEAAVAEYVRCFRDPECVAATCEDYRAAATIDLVHDARDSGRRLGMPLLALWGARGVVGTLYDVLAVWKRYAAQVEGFALPCGHFLPEEAPEATARALISFFLGPASARAERASPERGLTGG